MQERCAGCCDAHTEPLAGVSRSEPDSILPFDPPPRRDRPRNAAAVRIPPHDLAKTVVYAADNGFGIAVAPADELVDLPEVARLPGSMYMRLADEGEVAETFRDCELDAMPPFGQPCNVPVLLDAELAEREFIALAVGTHSDVVRMSMVDYRKLVRPLIGGFTLNHAHAG
jgi:Ala-tRNA(Pro) deacylase